MKKFENVFYGLSFGEQYLVASIVYLGLSLMLIGAMPNMDVALAQSSGCAHQVPVYVEGTLVYNTVPGCPNGQLCCGTSCIGSGQGCCNGIPYNTSTHGCCAGVIYNRETHKCCCDGDVKLKDDCCDCD